MVGHKLLVVVLTLATALVISGCISFPPRYDPNPHVVVEYKCAALLQNPTDALFLKSVTQYVTKAHYEYHDSGFIFAGGYYGWTFSENAVWQRLFMCSVNVGTGQKSVVHEWPQGFGEASECKLSRPLGCAALLVGHSYGGRKVAVINLHTFEWHYIKLPNSPYSAPSAIDLSPDERRFAVAIRFELQPEADTQRVEGIAVCNFEGQFRFLPTAERPLHVGWMQKSNLIRVTMETKYLIVEPNKLSIIEEGKLDRSNRYGQLPSDESRPPLDAQYESRTVNLGTPGRCKGRFSPGAAASFW